MTKALLVIDFEPGTMIPGAGVGSLHLNSMVACAGPVANSMPLFPSGEIGPAFLTMPGQFILSERHSRRFVPAQRRSAPALVACQCSGQPCHILPGRIQQRLFRFLSKRRRFGIDATTANFRISRIHAGFGEKIDSRQTRGPKIQIGRQCLSGTRDLRQTRESSGITVQGRSCTGCNLQENRRIRSHTELAPTRRPAFVAGMAPVVFPSAADAAGFREISADGAQVGIRIPSDTRTTSQRPGPFGAEIAGNAPFRGGAHELVLFSHGNSGFYRNHRLTAQVLGR